MVRFLSFFGRFISFLAACVTLGLFAWANRAWIAEQYDNFEVTKSFDVQKAHTIAVAGLCEKVPTEREGLVAITDPGPVITDLGPSVTSSRPQVTNLGPLVNENEIGIITDLEGGNPVIADNEGGALSNRNSISPSLVCQEMASGTTGGGAVRSGTGGGGALASATGGGGAITSNH